MKKNIPDFDRDVHCLLGLAIDALTLEQATAVVRDAALSGRRCFLSTPNLNFLVQSQHAIAFRTSIINSDLSTADGTPIVWFSRLMGIPIPERVAGADIFEELLHSTQRPAVKVYIFGGPTGAGEMASAKINGSDQGVVCVGYGNPGFGSIEDMSSQEKIDAINRCAPDFVLVALGAAKGQTWIEFNMDRLHAAVISHLGAVVNFTAGTVVRAPRFAQRIGIEWLWRIKEEPTLWKRYVKDGWGMLGLLLHNVLPSIFFRMCMGKAAALKCAVVESGHQPGAAVLKLSGAAVQENMKELRALLATALQSFQHLTLDLTDVVQVDSSFLGLVLLLQNAVQKNGGRLYSRGSSWPVKGYFKTQCVVLINPKA